MKRVMTLLGVALAIAGVLKNRTVSYTYTKIFRLIPDRMQTLEMFVNDKDINLINIYGPNNDDGNFFEHLEKHLR